MAERKKVPPETQKTILLQSRRRCCLCFWLDGIDEVVKGQIAHLDGDRSNNEFDNLAFLCFDHHDEYDGETRLAKGLRQDEVKQWRDELYDEMAYRFRTVKTRRLELTISRFLLINPKAFSAEFHLRNSGRSEVKGITVSIRLPDNVTTEPPQPPEPKGDPSNIAYIPAFVNQHRRMNSRLFGFSEVRENFFEPNGRVAIIDVPLGIHGILLPGHSATFGGLGFSLTDCPEGSVVKLDYRIDAQDMEPTTRVVQSTVHF